MKNSDNKYYTPKQEEFHIGFEYEELNETTNVWHPNSITQFCDLDLVECELEQETGIIRVKHLDREDIESLGFNIDITKSFQKNELVICETDFGSALNEYCKIIYNIKNQEANIEDCCEMALFIGKIKNKSELKRLLIQLGVIQI